MGEDFFTHHFPGHSSAQAWTWDYSDGHRTLVSYGTLVAECTSDGWIRVLMNYDKMSQTTKKHVSWFAKELNCTLQDFKRTDIEHIALNIHTGETRDYYGG